MYCGIMEFTSEVGVVEDGDGGVFVGCMFAVVFRVELCGGSCGI